MLQQKSHKNRKTLYMSFSNTLTSQTLQQVCIAYTDPGGWEVMSVWHFCHRVWDGDMQNINRLCYLWCSFVAYMQNAHSLWPSTQMTNKWAVCVCVCVCVCVHACVCVCVCVCMHVCARQLISLYIMPISAKAKRKRAIHIIFQGYLPSQLSVIGKEAHVGP